MMMATTTPKVLPAKPIHPVTRKPRAEARGGMAGKREAPLEMPRPVRGTAANGARPEGRGNGVHPKPAKSRLTPRRGGKLLPQGVRRRKAARVEPEPQAEAIGTAGERYWEAVGRRKTAIARVRLFTRGGKGVWVNTKPLADYFRYPPFEHLAAEALEAMKSTDRFLTSVIVRGGGSHAQAEAIRHGTARALVLFNPDFRKRLKRAGFLTRDPRMKERKKFGLKGARRAPQWQKR